MGFYIPAALLIVWGLYGALTLPRLNDPMYIRHPERRLWSLWRFLDSREWTADGLAVRGRYLRFYGVALALMSLGVVVGLALEAR